MSSIRCRPVGVSASISARSSPSTHSCVNPYSLASLAHVVSLPLSGAPSASAIFSASFSLGSRLRRPAPVTGDPERDRTTVSMSRYVLYRESYVSRRVFTRTDANSSTSRSSSYPIVVGSSLWWSRGWREGGGQRTKWTGGGENFQNRLPRKGPLRELSNAPVVGIARHLLPTGSDGDLARFQLLASTAARAAAPNYGAGLHPHPPSFTLNGRLQHELAGRHFAYPQSGWVPRAGRHKRRRLRRNVQHSQPWPTSSLCSATCSPSRALTRRR